MPAIPSPTHWRTWNAVGALSVLAFVLSLAARDHLVAPLRAAGIPFGLLSGALLGLAVLSVFQFLYHLTGEDVADER
jgi:hypothetical protein